MWFYYQKNGLMYHDATYVSKGYSGKVGDGKNNPEMQNVKKVGPIPVGKWSIDGPPVDTEDHGPYVLHLTPDIGTETFGRGDFLIHGDNIVFPGTASEGCIIMPRFARKQIWESNDHRLEVLHS